MGSLVSRLPTALWCGSHLACVLPVTVAWSGSRGVCPARRSAALLADLCIEIINEREKVLGQGRFGTDRDGYTAMLKLGRRHKDRVWAVEGCNGIGRHLAQRLVADGETVLDVPAKLSARARLFDTN